MIEAFTKAKIEELGDTDCSLGTERPCTVLSYQHFVRGGRSVIQIDGECYQIESRWLYVKDKRTKQHHNISREELDKLPKTVSYQKPLNFFAKPAAVTHKVSEVMQMVRRAGNPSVETRRSAWMNMNYDIQISLDAPIERVNITGIV